MNRSERIKEHTRTIRDLIGGKARWHNCKLDNGLELSTRVAVLDSRALHEIEQACGELLLEAMKLARRDRSGS